MLKFFGPICKLQRMWIVVNTITGTVFTILQFLCSWCLGTISWHIRLHKAVKAHQWQMLMLIGPIWNFQRKWIVVNTVKGTIFTILQFLCSWCLGTISWRVRLQKAEKAYQRQMLKLFGPICKLQRIWIVVNTITGTVFTILQFLCSLCMGPIN
jgi:hypothetical protein